MSVTKRDDPPHGSTKITTWQQVADMCDESTWDRVVGDLAPKSRAEALACRPSRAHIQPTLFLVPPLVEDDP